MTAPRPTFDDRLSGYLADAFSHDRQADWARGNGRPAYRGGCEPGALWPVLEPSPPPPPDIHDYPNAWIGLALLLATALLAFGAGWVVRGWA